MKKLPKLIGKGREYSDEEIGAELIASKGSLARVAFNLDISRAVVARRVRESEDLAEIVRQIEEVRLDMAESNVHEALMAKKEWATKFYLTKKGQSRGYGEEATPSVAIQINITDTELG